MCLDIILCCSGNTVSYLQLRKESSYFLSFSVILPFESSLKGLHGLLFTDRWPQHVEGMCRQWLLHYVTRLDFFLSTFIPGCGVSQTMSLVPLFFIQGKHSEFSSLLVALSSSYMRKIQNRSLISYVSTLIKSHLYFEDSKAFTN